MLVSVDCCRLNQQSSTEAISSYISLIVLNMKQSNIQYFQTTFEKKEAPKQEGLKISGYASTKTKDRYGDIVDPTSFKNSIRNNYKKNPIILAYHDSTRPAGRAEVLKTDEDGLYIEALITDRGEVRQHVEDGVLRTFSIGYIPTKLEFINKDGEKLNPQTDNIWAEDVTRIIKALDLIEISIVSTPANPDALFTLQKSVKSFFEKAKDEEADFSQYQLTKNIMKSKNLLAEVKDEEVVDTPTSDDSKPAEIPAEQGGAEAEKVETPNSETPVKEEGVEINADDNSESDEGKKEEEKIDSEEPKTEKVEDSEDENKNIKIEIEGKSFEIPQSLISAKTIAELSLKVATLEAKLESMPAQQPLIYQENSIAPKKEIENKENCKGFKAALIQSVN